MCALVLCSLNTNLIFSHILTTFVDLDKKKQHQTFFFTKIDEISYIQVVPNDRRMEKYLRTL